MDEDTHLEHEQKKNYVTVEPFRVVSSEIEEVEVEIDDEPVLVEVHYHYTDAVPGTYEDPPEPAEVEIIRIKTVANQQVLYSCHKNEWADIITDKTFKELELHLLEKDF